MEDPARNGHLQAKEGRIEDVTVAMAETQILVFMPPKLEVFMSKNLTRQAHRSTASS